MVRIFGKRKGPITAMQEAMIAIEVGQHIISKLVASFVDIKGMDQVDMGCVMDQIEGQDVESASTT